MLWRPETGANESGFIIVPVLWIIAALASLTIIYSLYARETALNFLDHDERLQAAALTESAVELAAYQLTAHSDSQPLQGQFSFRQGSAAVTVHFRCENSLIDLNFAPQNVLVSFFVGIGIQPEEATNFANRIMAWRAPLRNGATDTEAGLYQQNGRGYGPRHGAFQDISELGLVAGLPSALIDRVLPYLTVYSGQPEVNVLAAPPQVLAALPGLTPERLQMLLNIRSNASQDIMRAQLGMTQSYITLNASRANRVSVVVQFASGRRADAQADIFLLPRDEEPYRVLSWRENTAVGSEQ